MDSSKSYIEIPPQQLSGDQNQQNNIVSTFVPQQKANIFLSITLVIKTTVGAGIISLPFVISQLGYILAIACFIIFAILNHFCCAMLLKAKNLSAHSKYSSILKHIFGGIGDLIGAAIIFLDNFGTCVMYLIVLKVSIRKIIIDSATDPDVSNNFITYQSTILGLVILLQYPFSILKKIQRLRILSLIGIVGIGIFIISFLAQYSLKRAQGFQGFTMKAFPTNLFSAFSVLPNIIFAYDYQINFFSIYKGLRDGDDKKMSFVSMIGVGGCCVCYLVIGLVGYSMIGQNAEANLLQSLLYNETNKILFYFINISFVISLLCSYSLQFFACRNNFILIVKRIIQHYQKPELQQQQQNLLQNRQQNKKKENRMFLLLTTIIYLLIAVVGLFLSNLQSVINLVGSICENLIAIILPCGFYVILKRRGQINLGASYYCCCAILIIAIPNAIFTLIANYL